MAPVLEFIENRKLPVLAFEGVSFITTFLRGAEWAASGKVTQAIPADFPTAKKATKRTFTLKE